MIYPNLLRVGRTVSHVKQTSLLKSFDSIWASVIYVTRSNATIGICSIASSSLMPMKIPSTKRFLHVNHANTRFKLDPGFMALFTSQKPPFGFNGLGELVYMRTYSRIKIDGTKEKWFETVERVVNGTFSMQKEWLTSMSLDWDEKNMQALAQEMYTRIFYMKFMPPGRGLWAMGSAITDERRLFAALNNCAFVSTSDIGTLKSPSEPFCFLMDLAMLGVGVGFDTKGAETIHVKGCDSTEYSIVVPDSREGWVMSIQVLIDAYLLGKSRPVFDCSMLRSAGTPIKGFGGVSSGPAALVTLHHVIEQILSDHVGKFLGTRAIVDIMNQIGVCIVSGNVRRTAEIAFGDYDDVDYVDLKDYEKNPDRAAYGWTSNNSIFAEVGMDYRPIAERIIRNGEPGFAWLHNMRNYGRMNGVKDTRDYRASGGNPCLEQTLESYEMCCLVETFPTNHENLEDYVKTLQFALLYAKTVTLGTTHWPRTNTVMLRNRRIGCSMSGISQFVSKFGLDELRKWCEVGYDALQIHDQKLSEQFAVPRSIKTTSIKPSGTVSLLAGVTPGIHYPESRYYIRRMRLDKQSELVPALKDAGYELEPAQEAPDSTLVVSIPVDVGENVRTLADVSMWEQFSLAAFLQRHWADNQVSCTVTFNPAKENVDQITQALNYFQYQLKGISLLPRISTGAYAQMPYEEINEDQYKQLYTRLRPLKITEQLTQDQVENVPDKFCEVCLDLNSDPLTDN